MTVARTFPSDTHNSTPHQSFHALVITPFKLVGNRIKDEYPLSLQPVMSEEEFCNYATRINQKFVQRKLPTNPFLNLKFIIPACLVCLSPIIIMLGLPLGFPFKIVWIVVSGLLGVSVFWNLYSFVMNSKNVINQVFAELNQESPDVQWAMVYFI